MITVGVDPDADRHGVAIYQGRRLVELRMMNLIEVRQWLGTAPGEIEFCIENVKAQNFVYGRNARKGGMKVVQNIILKVGRCQQAQEELVRELEHRGIRYRLVKPCKDNWAKNKPLFERVTGWRGRSNEDTRAAAYFGYVGLSGG